tara:strand:- start:15520 stop:17898 length:2379 start_codon:yes stop_codon:yes gene_type:complete
MKKTLLFFLVLLIFSCNNSLKKELNLIDFVPTNPVLLVKYNSTIKANTENFNKNFNLLINHKTDSISKRFFEDPVLVSYHKIGKKNIETIVFSKVQNIRNNFKVQDSVKYSGYVIKKQNIENVDYFSSVKNGIYMESKSKLLIENTLRNSNYMSTEKSSNLRKLFDISDSNITIFISENFSRNLNDLNLNNIFNLSEITDWMQYDIEINKNSLILNGLGILQDSVFKKINILQNTTPTLSKINKIIPTNFKYFQRKAYDHYAFISSIESEISIDEIKKTTNDSLLYDVDEIGSIILENDTILTYNFKNNQLLSETITKNLNSKYEYRRNTIYEFSKKIFKTENHLDKYSPYKTSYGTILDDILVLSKNKLSLENIILNNNNNSNLEKSSKFIKAYNNIPEKSNQLGVYNLDHFQPSMFKKLKLKKEDYGFWISHLSLDKNFIYKTQSIVKTEKEINRIGPKIIFNTKLNNDIYFKPKWVKNYVTKQKELVVQDNKNILYLISNEGEIIWEKDLKSKIVGDIFQIDLYKNGRLQYAFNTEKSLMILDKNGKEVKKVDHKNNVKVLGLAIFDYEKNKNYRFLICYDNQVKMLNSKMQIVKGFNKNNIKHKITNTPKHFRVGSKDYLIFNTKKKLYVTDRRGNTRIKINENLNISGNEIFLNNNSLFSLDNNNSLNRIDLEGKISKKPLPLESKYLIYATNNNSIYISENILTVNKKNIEMKYGNYSKPIIFSDDLFQITNLDESKLYLFKKDGTALTSFPIFGSSEADITVGKDNKKMIAVCGEKNEILVYSIN